MRLREPLRLEHYYSIGCERSDLGCKPLALTLRAKNSHAFRRNPNSRGLYAKGGAYTATIGADDLSCD